MKRIIFWSIIPVVISLLLTSCNTRQADVSEEHVARIIKTLSSDSLKGRHAFRPEIQSAARVIASEFEDLGLSYIPGEDDYLQKFTVHTITADSSKIRLNNEPVRNDHYFGILNAKDIHWETGDVEIGVIGKDEKFRDSFRKYASDDQSSLVLIDRTHKNWFHRYKAWYSGRNRTFELNQAPTDIFVLTADAVNTFQISFHNQVTSVELMNVTGVLEGNRPDEIVLFSAHYDHLGLVEPTEMDSIANGANDNASGVSGVIEIARYYSQLPQQERTLYFTAFTAEESGGLGSKYVANQVNPDNIIAMLNLEMIGKPSSEGSNTAWITGFNYSSLGNILQTAADDSSFSFYPDPYQAQNLFYRSDNAPFARLGIPAHTISTTPIDVDRDYHTVADEFHTLDISHTAHTIQAIAEASRVIISGEQTPTRINPDSLR